LLKIQPPDIKQPPCSIHRTQLFLSIFLFWFSLLSFFLPYGGVDASAEGLPWSVTAMIIGGVWYMITKVMIWWNQE